MSWRTRLRRRPGTAPVATSAASAPNIVTPTAPSTTPVRPIPPLPPRPVLADPDLDAALARFGWVETPLVSPAGAAELRADWLALHGDGGEGFEADLTNPDIAYRRAVAHLAAERLGRVVGDLFVDGRPFLWNFLVKWPGEPEDLYLHRDWWFIDERAGSRTHLVWLALQDVTAENGPLKVLTGSHRFTSEPVGTEVGPSWLGQARLLQDRLSTVTLQAGHAIVFDHALVHGSFRNLTDDPRVVLGCAVRPATAPLVHFRRDDPAAAVRYDVDEDFFVTETPAGLMERPPARDVAERLELPADRVYSGDLAAELDAMEFRHGVAVTGDR